ncbi:hypothetical protein BaRGS_00027489 [Batillaria attramentaria]|uniref:C2H2-type domain-containing protein n=1 Tax=Batillaria attramentaria TaxID=370345 RepID=A0ABD0K2F7_9CAEN
MPSLQNLAGNWGASDPPLQWPYQTTPAEPDRHACRNCGKTFAYSYNMVRHRRQCEGTFHLVCGVCGKKFHRRDVYAVHLNTVHGLQDDKRRSRADTGDE